MDTLITSGISIAVIGVTMWGLHLVLTRTARRVVRSAVERAEVQRRDPAEVQRRADTMVSTVSWIVQAFVSLLAMTLVFSELGFEITAVAAGVGLVGIALGLGAQSLVRDVVNGLFILVEDQFGVGDVVEIAGLRGVVEDLNPRRTVLRDLNGNVHIVPNGAITVTTNMTHRFSRINLDIGVGYGENLGHAIDVINEVCAELAAANTPACLAVPTVTQVSELAEHAVIVKVVGDVQAGAQWQLTSDLRRRVKLRFDDLGIELPSPQLAVSVMSEPA